MPPRTVQPCGVPGCQASATPETGARVVVLGQVVFLCEGHADHARAVMRGAIKGGLSGLAKVVQEQAPSLFNVAVAAQRATKAFNDAEVEPAPIYVDAKVGKSG